MAAPNKRFYIGQPSAGLQTDLKPFAVPDDAFVELNNAYVFRGRVRKRFGSKLMSGTAVINEPVAQLESRVRIAVGTTNAVTGDFPLTAMPGVIGKIGQMFSVGDTIFTVYQANGATYTTGVATATYNTATRQLQITGNNENPSTTVYFYPAEPIMGIVNFEDAGLSFNPVYAFDTQFAYQYTPTGWQILGPVPPAAGSAIWTGTNADFFWAATYRGAQAYESLLYVTNYVAADGMYYYNPLTATWSAFTPVYNTTGGTIRTARIIVPFKGRLVLLNTIENDGVSTNTFVNRCRYSQIGDPIVTAPAADASFNERQGKGGFVDAPTREAIVTAQFLYDRLIVYFENSTWELVYTNNEILPFRWQQINTELGAESTFSQVPFDRVVLGVGNVGIHACNGTNVERIDSKIPDEVFKIHNIDSGVERVAGIRDYFVEMVYWTFPSLDATSDFPYPNRVLTYNYITGSWAFNDDSITAFGYYQPDFGATWASTVSTWEQTEDQWNSGQLQARFRNVLAGNQQGFVFIVDPNTPRNSPSLQITDIAFGVNTITITAPDHNLRGGDYVLIENCQGITGLNGKIYQVSNPTNSPTTFTIQDPSVTSGTYTGAGTLARVSQIDISTKQFNFYGSEGRNCTINKVDFLVDKNDAGEIQVQVYPSTGLTSTQELTLVTAPFTTLYPYEALQTQLWHPVYPLVDGEYVQFTLYWNDAQMRTPEISLDDFQLHAFIVYARASSSRLQ